MKKAIVLALTLALVAGAISAPAALAGKKKKKKAPVAAAPVTTKLFMHGSSPLGEIDAADHIQAGTYFTMDATAGSSEKSMGLVNYVGGPNTACAGNSLFPVWTGRVVGTITGDVKVTFDAMSSPGKVDVRIWPDIVTQACNEAYPEPAGHVTVDLPPAKGPVEAVIKGVNFPAQAILMVQITPVLPTEGGTPFLGRMFYDTEASSIEFSCTPSAGASSCTG
jgi:hypothetical protein